MQIVRGVEELRAAVKNSRGRGERQALVLRARLRNQEAAELAERAGVPVTQAEIEGNIGNFALLRGRYDQALDYLERSRRRYEFLGMPHQSARAEREIADAYLELNLVPEAAEIYARVTGTFETLGLRADEARTLASRGRAELARRWRQVWAQYGATARWDSKGQYFEIEGRELTSCAADTSLDSP